MVTQEEIQNVARRIVEEFRPERVILFGSYAYGTPNADSDVDFLIVMQHEGKTYRKAAEIEHRVHPPFPADIPVRSPEELQRRLDLGDFLLREITEKGRVLYEEYKPAH